MDIGVFFKCFHALLHVGYGVHDDNVAWEFHQKQPVTFLDQGDEGEEIHESLKDGTMLLLIAFFLEDKGYVLMADAALEVLIADGIARTVIHEPQPIVVLLSDGIMYLAHVSTGAVEVYLTALEIGALLFSSITFTLPILAWALSSFCCLALFASDEAA